MRTSVNVQRNFRQPYPFASFEALDAAGLCAPDPVEFLSAKFPVVRRLVGNGSFRAMACRFIASRPLGCPDLLQLGEAFPHFLRCLGDAASIEYVADIAELEMVRSKARHAENVLPIRVQAVSSLRLECYRELRVVLHPSVFLVASRFPIVTVWKNNRSVGKNTMIYRWRAEPALVARPFLDVQVWCLPAGGHTFISALAAGHTISTAIDAGRGAAPEFNAESNLAMLDETNIVIGLRDRNTVS